MTFKLMKQILTDPVAAINRGKKIASRKHEHWELIVLLLAEWTLIGLGIATALRSFGATAALGAGTILALIGLLATLFKGFLIQLVFHILGGKGNYWTGLGTAVYAKFPLAFGIFIASILFMVPVIGFIVGGLLLVVMSIISIAVFYRAIKELFRVDIVTAWVGIGILVVAIIAAAYISMILISPMKPAMLTLLAMGKTA